MIALEDATPAAVDRLRDVSNSLSLRLAQYNYIFPQVPPGWSNLELSGALTRRSSIKLHGISETANSANQTVTSVRGFQMALPSTVVRTNQ